MKGFIAVELTRSQLGDNYEYSTNPVKVYLATEVEAALAEKDAELKLEQDRLCYAESQLSRADSALAEKDAEIAKLRAQVEALREAREAWKAAAYKSDSKSKLLISDPTWDRAEVADDKARACGALEE